MDDDATPMIQPTSTKASPPATPSEAELSRIAREAVHQQADPRLDRQLARIGGVDLSEPASDKPGQPTRAAVVSGPELERLAARLHRIELILAALVVAVGILAVVAVILLLR